MKRVTVIEDGRVFEFTGEVRPPKSGEWYMSCHGYPRRWRAQLPDLPAEVRPLQERPILREVQTEEWHRRYWNQRNPGTRRPSVTPIIPAAWAPFIVLIVMLMVIGVVLLVGVMTGRLQ